MNVAPQTRFLQSKEDVATHASIVQSSSFIKAMDLALLQFAENLGRSNDPHAAMANCHRMEGARDFIALFKNFGTTPTVRSRKDTTNLQGNVN